MTDKNKESVNESGKVSSEEEVFLNQRRLRHSSYAGSDQRPPPIPVYKQKQKVIPCLLVLLGIFLLTIMSVTIAKNNKIEDREQTYEDLTKDNAQKPDQIEQQEADITSKTAEVDTLKATEAD